MTAHDEAKLTPALLRVIADGLEPMRGYVVASGEVEDGTDTSVGAGLLIDGIRECATAWEEENEAQAKRIEARDKWPGQFFWMGHTEGRLWGRKGITREEMARCIEVVKAALAKGEPE